MVNPTIYTDPKIIINCLDLNHPQMVGLSLGYRINIHNPKNNGLCWRFGLWGLYRITTLDTAEVWMRVFWVEHRLKERSELRLGVNSRNIVSVSLTMSEGRWYPQERWKQMSSLFSRILLCFGWGVHKYNYVHVYVLYR
jgi:hypothetical protein